MALYECKDCGHKVSDTARCCPQCGSINPGFAAATAPDEEEKRAGRIQMFLNRNMKFFSPQQLPDVRSRLQAMSDKELQSVEYMEFRDPTVMLIISVVVGSYGVDRFMLEDMTNGILKLVLLFVTCGIGTLVWWIYDIFKMTEMTYDYNYRKFCERPGYC